MMEREDEMGQCWEEWILSTILWKDCILHNHPLLRSCCVLSPVAGLNQLRGTGATGPLAVPGRQEPRPAHLVTSVPPTRREPAARDGA